MSRLSVHEHHGMAMLIMKERGEIAANYYVSWNKAYRAVLNCLQNRAAGEGDV